MGTEPGAKSEPEPNGDGCGSRAAAPAAGFHSAGCLLASQLDVDGLVAQCIDVVVLPGWKQQVSIHSWRTDDELMVVVAVMTGSAAHRHELDEGVEGGVVLKTSLHH